MHQQTGLQVKLPRNRFIIRYVIRFKKSINFTLFT